MESTGRIRLMVVEDDALLRSTLVELLKLDPELNVVADAANGALALSQLEQAAPDVVLMDIAMPVMDGIGATRMIRSRLEKAAIVILTKFDDDASVFEAIKAGATGYVLKDAGMSEIKEAIREAHQGQGHLNPAMVARVMAEFGRVASYRESSRQVFAELTRREVEVLELLGKGRRNRQIAEELFLSEKTVKAHIGAILRKLHVNDRTEAALLAQKHGLVG